MNRFLLIVLAVCMALHSSPVEAKDRYKKALDKYTRSSEVYWKDNLHAAIMWTATLLETPMLDAMAKKYSEVYEAPSIQSEQLAELQNFTAGETLFYVSFYYGNRFFADLLNPRARWEVTLRTKSNVYKPVRLEKTKKPTPLDHLYFPYINQWATGYYIGFPAEAMNERPFTLEVHGPQAHTELLWE